MIWLLHRTPIRSLTLIFPATTTTTTTTAILLSSSSSSSSYTPRRSRHSSRDYYRTRKPKNSTRRTPPHDPAQLQRYTSQLPPRFTPEDLTAFLARHRDPGLCVHLFHWAIQHPRFRPHASTYLITIKKLGAAGMYSQMDAVATQALSVASVASEELYNTIIYFYAEARMLSSAVGVYKKMRDSADLSCRPTLRTYNLLFAAMLSREGNSFINHMYMDNIRCLFRQMVDGGVEPDIHALNAVIKGYVLSMHLNDALRVFHQMGVSYRCVPDENTYNYLVHGLCAQGRTNNARELMEEMKGKGLVPGDKAYNSVVSALALNGEVDEAVRVLWEMVEKGRPADELTYRTVLGEICGKERVGDAMALLRELRGKNVIDGRTCKELMVELHDEYGCGGTTVFSSR